MGNGTWAPEIIYLWLSHFIRIKLKRLALKRVYQMSHVISPSCNKPQKCDRLILITAHSFFLNHEIVEYRTYLAISSTVQNEIRQARYKLVIGLSVCT